LALKEKLLIVFFLVQVFCQIAYFDHIFTE